MRAPNISKSKKNWIYNTIEKNCKSNGKYLKKEIEKIEDLNKFVNKVLNIHPAYKNSLKNCFQSVKNILKEIVKWIQIDQKVKSFLQFVWFKSFVNMIVACVRTGLNFALGWVTRFVKFTTSNLLNGVVMGVAAAYFIPTTLTLSLVAAIIIIGSTLLYQLILDKEYKLRQKPSFWQNIKEKIISFLSLENDEEIPEELYPPETNPPNITAIKIGENAELAAGVLFVLVLKAVIAAKFNEELQRKINIFKPLLVPTTALMSFLMMLILLGNGSASVIV